MPSIIFPKHEWETVTPAGAGFDAAQLEAAKAWLDSRSAEKGYRFVIVRRRRRSLCHGVSGATAGGGDEPVTPAVGGRMGRDAGDTEACVGGAGLTETNLAEGCSGNTTGTPNG